MSRDSKLPPEYFPYLQIMYEQPQPQPPLVHPTPLHHFANYQMQQQHHQLLQMSNPSAAAFEMTAAAAAAATAAGNARAVVGGAGLHPMPLLDAHKKEPNPEDYEMEEVHVSGSEYSHSASSANRKRKCSSYGSVSTYDEGSVSAYDEGSVSAYDAETRSSRSSNTDKRQNHSEIEKRRRDKMNNFISELSAMIPMCGGIARKLDKLTVLRMAVQHLRTVRGSLTACPLDARSRPPFVSDKEMNELIVHAAEDSFLLVVSCDRGRLLYVSHNVNTILNYDQTELLGQSMFDILHPKDVAKVKEQLSSSDLSPRERLIDAKTMLPLNSDVLASTQRLCTGARRSFFCRIKCKATAATATATVTATATATAAAATFNERANHNTKQKRSSSSKKYCVVQCTGYLKSWAPAEMMPGRRQEGEEDHSTMSCLVAIGRALPTSLPSPCPHPSLPTRTMQYVSRHAIDGKFLFVDQRVTLVLGFLPQEMVGTSLYEYVSGPALGTLARTHKQALVRRHQLHTPPYQFRCKDGSYLTIRTHFKPFRSFTQTHQNSVASFVKNQNRPAMLNALPGSKHTVTIRNPWTKDMDSLVANNVIVTDGVDTDAVMHDYEDFRQTESAKAGTGSEAEAIAYMQRMVDSHVSAQKIGAAIAEEAMRRPSSAAPHEPLLMHDPLFSSVQSPPEDPFLVDIGGCPFDSMQYSPPAPPSHSDSPPRTSVDDLAMLSLFDPSLMPPGEILQDPDRHWPHRKESNGTSSAMAAVSSWLSNSDSFNTSTMPPSISAVVSSSSTPVITPQAPSITPIVSSSSTPVITPQAPSISPIVSSSSTPVITPSISAVVSSSSTPVITPQAPSISPVVSSSSTPVITPQGRVINNPLTLSWLSRLQTMTRGVTISTVHRRRSNWRCPPPAPVEPRRMMPPLDYRPRFLVPENGELFRRRWPVVLRSVLSVWHLPVSWEEGLPRVRRQAAWDRDRAALLSPHTLMHLRLVVPDARGNVVARPAPPAAVAAAAGWLRTALLRCRLVMVQRRRVSLECEAWPRSVVTVALRHTFYWSGSGAEYDVLAGELAGLGRVSSTMVAGVDLRFARTFVQVDRRLCRPAVRTARVGPRRTLLADSAGRAVTLNMSKSDRVHVAVPRLRPDLIRPKPRMKRRQP